MPKNPSAELQKLASEVASLRKQREYIESEWARVQGEFLAKMKKEGFKSITVPGTKEQATVTAVTPEDRAVINEDRLKKKLGSAMWNKVTKRVLDRAKLEQQVAAEVIDPVVIAECSEMKPSTPYAKVTRKAAAQPVVGFVRNT